MTDCTPCLEDKNQPAAVPATTTVDGVNVCDRHRKIAELRAAKKLGDEHVKNVEQLALTRDNEAAFIKPPIRIVETPSLTGPPVDAVITEVKSVVVDGKEIPMKNVDWAAVQRDRDLGLPLAAVIIKYAVSADDIRRNTVCNKAFCPKKRASAKKEFREQEVRRRSLMFGVNPETLLREEKEMGKKFEINWKAAQEKRDAGVPVEKIAETLGCTTSNVYLNTRASKRSRFDKKTAGSMRAKRPNTITRSAAAEKILNRYASRSKKRIREITHVPALDEVIARLEAKRNDIDCVLNQLKKLSLSNLLS